MSPVVSQVVGRVCGQCRVSIDHRHAKARFCSDECYQLNYYILHRASKPAEAYVREGRTCEHCGASIDDRLLGTRFCDSSCYNKHRVRSKRPTGRVCKRCDVSIDHLNMKAVYCSQRCRTRNRYLRQKGRSEEVGIAEDRRCVVCEVSIADQHGLAKHCSTCKPAQWTKTINAHSCKHCGVSLAGKKVDARYCSPKCYKAVRREMAALSN